MKVFNKKAGFNYLLTPERIEAGIVLTGGEAKAARNGHIDLSQSSVRVMSGEMFLINAAIPVQGALNYNPTRIRKLLVHKKEIVSLTSKLKSLNLQIVPVSMYNKRSLIKVGLSLGKPKRKFEKRDSIKKKDIQREIEQEFRGKID